MLSDSEFEEWCKRLNLSEKAKSEINHIRSSPPARRVRSGIGNVRGVFNQSRKMQHSIQFESRTVEGPAILMMDYDDDVLEIWDQPPSFTIGYKGANGKMLGHIYTADFFVLRQNCAGWEEWKPEERLQKLTERTPNRYQLGSDGKWRCPPGEEHSSRFDLYFHVHSSAEINWVLQRNYKLLQPFLLEGDDSSGQGESPNSQLAETILSTVAASPGITFAELLDKIDGITIASVYKSIALKLVYVNLLTAWIGEPERVHMYRDSVTASFFERLSDLQASHDRDIPQVVDLVPGTSLLWDGVRLKIIHIGRTEISLRRDTGEYVHFANEDFQQFIKEKRVSGFIARPEVKRGTDIYEIAKKIETKEAMAEALRRWEILKLRREGGSIQFTNVNDRTVRNWSKNFDAAEVRCGNGLLGLLPNHSGKGNRTDRLSTRVRALMEEVVQTQFATPVKKTKVLVYGAFTSLCENNGIDKPPTYKTFIKEIKKLTTPEMVEKMEGSKVAYQISDFLEHSDMGMSVHGDRPWEYTHIDHTEMDEELLHSVTKKNMGKAWVTLLIDSFSRLVLAYYVTYDPPSYRSLLGVMRECVRKHNRLPEAIIADNGKDLKSIYFEQLLARYECNYLSRPPSKPRFGAVIERFIHTLNKQFIHNLKGNTKAMKKARQVTQAVNPKNLTVWNLPMLDRHLHHYFYEEYNNREHSALGRSPREEFDAALARFELPMIPVSYNEDFIMKTLPSTRSGVATVAAQRGIKVNGYFYRSNKLRKPELYKTKVPVRYDPYNMGVIYAYVYKEWVVCLAPPRVYFLLKNHSEREMQIIFEEERQKYRTYGRNFNERAKELALKQAEREQSETVEEQRLRDSELRKVAQSRNGLHAVISHLQQPSDETQSADDDYEVQQRKRRTSDTPKIFGAAKRESW